MKLTFNRGWLATGTGLGAMLQGHAAEKENRRSRYGW